MLSFGFCPRLLWLACDAHNLSFSNKAENDGSSPFDLLELASALIFGRCLSSRSPACPGCRRPTVLTPSLHGGTNTQEELHVAEPWRSRLFEKDQPADGRLEDLCRGGKLTQQLSHEQAGSTALGQSSALTWRLACLDSSLRSSTQATCSAHGST